MIGITVIYSLNKKDNAGYWKLPIIQGVPRNMTKARQFNFWNNFRKPNIRSEILELIIIYFEKIEFFTKLLVSLVKLTAQ